MWAQSFGPMSPRTPPSRSRGRGTRRARGAKPAPAKPLGLPAPLGVAAPEPTPAAPSTIAVAIKDERGSQRITATGRGAVAEQILALAFANGVKVRTDADLAEVLSVLDVDSPIPLAALAAVAEILRYVYLANRTVTNPGTP